MLLGILGCLFTSCFSDLDTMPLDDNELVSEKVYQTADGYTGVLAKCYSSLILTGQKGGDGGDGDLEGANEGYSGYVRLMFYLQELPTDNFIMPSSSKLAVGRIQRFCHPLDISASLHVYSILQRVAARMYREQAQEPRTME